MAQEVTRKLTAPGVVAYRVWWKYLAASWAGVAALQSDDAERSRLAIELQRDATSAGRVVAWFPRFDGAPDAPAVGPDYDWRAVRAAEWLDARYRGSRLERELSRIRDGIDSDEAGAFERGLEGLGEVLGFEAVRPHSTSDPDACWRDGETAWILWEAKTEEKSAGPLSTDDVRQANSHRNWTERALGWSTPDRSMTVIVSPKTEVDGDAQLTAEAELYLVEPETVRDLVEPALDAIRQAAGQAPSLTVGGIAEAIRHEWARRQLGTADLADKLAVRPVAERDANV